MVVSHTHITPVTEGLLTKAEAAHNAVYLVPAGSDYHGPSFKRDGQHYCCRFTLDLAERMHKRDVLTR